MLFMMRGMMGGGTRSGDDDHGSSRGGHRESTPSHPTDVNGSHERLDRR
jgi:hypothetical protein